MADDFTFHAAINGGPKQAITVRTSLYELAAAAALDRLTYPESEDGRYIVRISSPEIDAMSIKQQRRSEAKRWIAAPGEYFFSWDGTTLGELTLSEHW